MWGNLAEKRHLFILLQQNVREQGANSSSVFGVTFGMTFLYCKNICCNPGKAYRPLSIHIAASGIQAIPSCRCA